jgi:hypothetical protein
MIFLLTPQRYRQCKSYAGAFIIRREQTIIRKD